MRNVFDPSITVTSPFPLAEYPTLFHWTQRARHSVADDTVPNELSEWMEWQQERAHHLDTWAIWGNNEIIGYVDCTGQTQDEPLLVVFHLSVIFKRDLWSVRNVCVALNLVLKDVFVCDEDQRGYPDIVVVRVIARNESMRHILTNIGFVNIGKLEDVKQGENLAKVDIYGITNLEWQKTNKVFIAESQAVAAVGD